MSSIIKMIDMRQDPRYNLMVSPKGNLGISRSQMPQIDSQYRDKFISWLKNKGIKVKTIRVPIKSLKLTQSEYDRDKVMTMIDKMKSDGKKKFPNLFVSSDGYVLDGSHRLIAKLNLNDSRYIDVDEIGMSMLELLNVVSNFPHCRYRTLQDKQVK